MKEKVEINRSENINEPVQKREIKKPRRSKWRLAGIYVGILLILAGIVWYAVNLGLIPLNLIIELAGPIIVVLIGIVIIIKSI